VCVWVKRCVRQLICPSLSATRICLSTATICGAGACGGCAQATVWTCVCGALQHLDFAGDWLLAEKREGESGGGCFSPFRLVNGNGELWMWIDFCTDARTTPLWHCAQRVTSSYHSLCFRIRNIFANFRFFRTPNTEYIY